MSNRLIYSPKNSIRCAPLRSFKSDAAAFRFGCWFVATFGNQRAAQWCEENGIVVTRAGGEGTNAAGGNLVPAEFLSVLYSVLDLRGVIRGAGEVIPIGREVASATKVLTGLTAYFTSENTASTSSDPVLGALNFIAKKLSTYTIISSELEEDALIDIGDMLMTLAASVQGPTARINPTSRSLSCMSRTVARAVSQFENFKCCRDTIRLLTRTDGQKRKLRTSDCFPESRRSGKPPERRTIRA